MGSVFRQVWLWPVQEKTWKQQKRVCNLQGESTEAVNRKNQYVHFGHEQQMFLPSEPLETIDRVLYSTSSVSFEPNLIDPGARIAAAQQNFLGSSACARQAMKFRPADVGVELKLELCLT